MVKSRLFQRHRGASWLVLIIAPYTVNTLTYLLTYLLISFLSIATYGITFEPCHCKIFIRSLECYKDAQMKTYDTTKLTAEPKSDDVQYRNKTTLLLVLIS